MEYMINNFNLADISFNEENLMSTYFNECIIGQRVRNILLGPNLLYLNYPKHEAKNNRDADKKILNTLCRLIYYNFNLQPEQFFIIQTGSNLAAKNFVKKLTKDLNVLINEKNIGESNLLNSYGIYEFLSFFTCFKDSREQEIAVCDFILEYVYEDNLLDLSKIEILNVNEDIVLTEFSSLNIFYMLFYNLPIDLLKKYLYCQKFNEYFNVFSEINVEEYVKRYLFISQFKMLKNDMQFEELHNSRGNQEVIRKEYIYYRKLYEKYLLILKTIKLDERKLFDYFFTMILISELEVDKLVRLEVDIEVIKRISTLLLIKEENILHILQSRAAGQGLFLKLLYKLILQTIRETINQTFIPHKPVSKFSILIARTNRSYKVFNTSDNLSIKDTIVNNYIRELKNYIFLKHSTSITSISQDYPIISKNEEFINLLLNKSQIIINIMKNLIRLVDDPNRLYEFQKKMRNQQTELMSLDDDIIRVEHTFGTYQYNNLELLKEVENDHKYSKQLNDICKLMKIPNKPTIEEYIKHETSYLKTLEDYRLTVYNTFIFNVLSDIDDIDEVLDDYKLSDIYDFYHNLYTFIFSIKDLKETFLKNKKSTPTLPKDNLVFFNDYIASKIRISKDAYYYDNNFIIAKNQFSRVLDNNNNIASLIYKYNYKMFTYLVTKKANHESFSKLSFAINCVRAYIKLTKVYMEKKVFKQIRELLMEIIIKHYPKVKEIDTVNKFTFDFQNEILAKNLPKLHSNLSQLKKIWKNYITDIVYLEINKSKFTYPVITERIIEERLDSFRTLLFLFSKSYKFINIEALRSILHLEFTKTITVDILNMMEKYYKDMNIYFKECNFNTNSNDEVNFVKLFKIQDSMKAIRSLNTKSNKKCTTESRRDLLPDSRYSKSTENIKYKEPDSNINLKNLLNSAKLISSEHNYSDHFFNKNINEINHTPNFKAEITRSSFEFRYSNVTETARDLSIVNEGSLYIYPDNSFQQSGKILKSSSNELTKVSRFIN
jgi:hypothetical protein